MVRDLGYVIWIFDPGIGGYKVNEEDQLHDVGLVFILELYREKTKLTIL